MARRNALRVVGAVETAPRLKSEGGASAEVLGETITIRDKAGLVVVIYDASSGTATISCPTGDLRLEAPNGKVIISAEKEIELNSKSTSRVTCERLEIDAKSSRVQGISSELLLESLKLAIPSVTLSVGRWQFRADHVFETAKEVFREVEGVVESRAGRMRTLVKGASQLFAKSTSVVSEEDTFIDGRRVLLG